MTDNSSTGTSSRASPTSSSKRSRLMSTGTSTIVPHQPGHTGVADAVRDPTDPRPHRPVVPGGSGEPGVEGDLGARRQQARDRTVLLGALGDLLEGALVDARDVTDGLEVDPGDAEAGVVLVEVHLGGGLHGGAGEAGVRESLREGHREAAGVRGADQLLRVRPLALLEARLERVVPLVTALAGLHRAGTLGEVPFPAGRSSANRHVGNASPCRGRWPVDRAPVIMGHMAAQQQPIELDTTPSPALVEFGP